VAAAVDSRVPARFIKTVPAASVGFPRALRFIHSDGVELSVFRQQKQDASDADVRHLDGRHRADSDCFAVDYTVFIIDREFDKTAMFALAGTTFTFFCFVRSVFGVKPPFESPAVTQNPHRGRKPAGPIGSRENTMLNFYRLAMIGAAVAVGIPARAQLITHRDLSAAMALNIAQTALATCVANSYRVSVTVLGRNAEIIVQVRGDGASPHTVENSFRKAYTSRTFRVPSGEIAKRAKDDPSLFMIHLSNVIAAEGALPIKVGDDVVGAVGVSGSPGGEKDAVCAQAGIDKIASDLK
jgi:uncharacterized protein GlcG (DUF336 family)